MIIKKRKIKNIKPPILNNKTDFMVTEAYKAIRTNLLFTVQNQGSRCIIITSTVPNEGKSINCCNLGITLAQTNSRVLILDCDLRRPFIHKCFDRTCEPGLSEYLAGMKNDLAEIIQNTDYHYLNILCGGTIPPNPAELLSSVKMKILLNTLSQEYDYVLLDTPPVNLVADALALSTLADGVILIVRHKHTTHPELARALASLKFANAKVLGIILNGIESSQYSHKRYRKYYRMYK